MARRLPSLNALRAFEAAGRHSSFTQAADELHVTHAAISRHVRQLEAWLGAPLFRRISRGVIPTEAGKRYQETLTQLFDKIARATDAVKAPEAAGALTISVETAFASRWLVPRLGRFQQAYPEVELALDPSDSRVNFRRDPAELAIRYGEGQWDDVEVTELIPLMAFPVCSPQFLEEQDLKDPQDLRHCPLIHEETKQWWGDWLIEAGVHMTGKIRGPMLQNAQLALEAAETGQGVALADNVLAADAIRAGRLVRLFDIVSPSGAYYIVRPTNTPESPAARSFRLWLESEIAAFKNLLPELGNGVQVA